MRVAVEQPRDVQAPGDVDVSPAVEAVEEEAQRQESSLDMAMDTSLPTEPVGEEAIYEPEYVTETQDIWGPISQAAEASYADVSTGTAMLPGQGTISQAFGVRNSGYAAGYHTGLDISLPANAPVRAPMGGTVIAAGWAGAYGNRVEIRHPDGKVSLLAHNNSLTVKVGQKVNAGQQVARAGSTGNSTGVHIHWEVRNPSNRYGDVVNPMTWLNSARSAPTTSRSTIGDQRTYTPQTAYQLARSVGATDSEARMLASVVMPESGGRPWAHNPNASTGDNSYGLWQINMLGAMGPERRRWFGISSNEQLFNPVVNARAALKILRSQGPRAWTTWRG